MKILVLGASGMLGHKVLQTLRLQHHDVHGIIHGTRTDSPLSRVELLQGDGILEGVEADDYVRLAEILRGLRPAAVVNCIGVVKQRPEATNARLSIAINALLPHQLVEICGSWAGRVIHLSTDCVFSGNVGHYSEADPSDAEDLYGKSKYLGEIGSSGERNALTLRTSMIGRELAHFRSLLEWFLGSHAGPIRGYTRAIYGGVTTNHLASLIATILSKHDGLSGVYQVASSPISKYDLLSKLRDAYRLSLEIIPDDSVVCDRSLRGEKLRAAIGYECPPWHGLIEELVSDPTPYQTWRTR
ncbi:MAG TPA: SDR family oxidoreductase [Polyangiaceae bacterium]|jgi:dTDP-4-dehydrorhamnose reductase